MIKILIAGGTGFLGKVLVQHFLYQGSQITVLGRSHKKIKHVYHHQVKSLQWSELNQQSQDFDVIINLVGARMSSSYWSNQRKQEFTRSRVESTQRLVEYCIALGDAAPYLINASGVAIYGLDKYIKKVAYTEDSPIPSTASQSDNFLQQLAVQWEQALVPMAEAKLPYTCMRLAVVLAKQGGVLHRLYPFYYLGLGGRIGTGHQMFPWVHVDDFVAAVDFIMTNKIRAAVNIVSPTAISQEDFSIALANVMRRPRCLHQPKWLIKAIFGQMGEEFLLSGQYTKPEYLLKHNFSFTYTNIYTSLKSILTS